jgi:hypothetical protein
MAKTRKIQNFRHFGELPVEARRIELLGNFANL